jgi:hypothetical protein
MNYFSRASSLACFDAFVARNGLDAVLMLKGATCPRVYLTIRKA